MYGYVGNNPISFVDPWGLKPGDWFNTPQEAAADAISSIPQSKDPRKVSEYAGQVFQDPSKCKKGKPSFVATGPNSVGNPIKSYAELSPAPSGSGYKLVGWYHGHHYLMEDPQTGKLMRTDNPLQDQYLGNQISGVPGQNATGDYAQFQQQAQTNPGFYGFVGAANQDLLIWHNGITTTIPYWVIQMWLYDSP